MIPVISIVGKSNSGKTTLIERIIPHLKAKGYKVGTIKHDAHHFEIDHEGKDTWRMTKSGADKVVISSKDKLALVKRLDDEEDLDKIIEWLFEDVDIIITEGYKSHNKPKIEVIRFSEPITAPKDNLIAIVDNTEENMVTELSNEYFQIYRLDMNRIDKITEFIIDRFLKKSKTAIV